MRASGARVGAVAFAGCAFLGLLVLAACGKLAPEDDGEAWFVDAAETDAIAIDAGADAQDAADFPWSNDVSLQYRGGSRLRPIWWVTEDGQRQFARWHDTLLDIDCAFDVAADGSLRCLPAPRYPGSLAEDVGDLSANPAYFSDSACSQPELAYWNWMPDTPGCVPKRVPRFARLVDSSGCPERTRVFPVDASRPIATIYVYEADAMPTQCFAAPNGPLDQAYALGDEMPPSAFVLGTESRGASAGGVAPRYVDGNDGSRGFAGFYDEALDTTCSFWPNDLSWLGGGQRGLRLYAQDGTVRCLPTIFWPATSPTYGGYIVAGAFANSTCSENVATNLDSHCPGRFAYSLVGHSGPSNPNCQPFTSIAEIEGDAGVVYRQASDGGCNQTVSTQAYYAASAPIDPATLSAAAHVLPPSGATRISPWKIALPGDLVETVGWHDTKLDTDCEFEPGADRALHCVPDGRIMRPTADVTFAFSDSACTSPVGITWQYDCLSLQPFALSFDDRTSVSPACYGAMSYAHVYPVGAAATRPYYELQTTAPNVTTCTVMPENESFLGPVFDLGAEIEASTFVSVGEVER